MNSAENIDIAKLQDRVAFLEENRRFIQNALEMALSLGDYQQNLNNGSTPHRILRESQSRIQQLIPFKAAAIYLVDENNSDFKQLICKPAHSKALLDDEVEYLVNKGYFAWAIREKRGLFVPSKDRSRRFVLHVIATTSRIRGMFVGLLSEKGRKIPDSAIMLMSIIFLNTANALESYEFYKFMRNQNITLKREIEKHVKELARSHKQLKQLDKIQAIGTLAGGIAHDFNNILSPILGYTEMILDDEPEDSKIRNCLEEVFIAANRAKDLVNQILTFSRQSNQEFKQFRVQPIIEESIQLLRASLPATIEIVHHIDKQSGATKGDATQIQQIIMNLCTNAFHAMEETGGKLEINLTEVDIDVESDLDREGVKTGRYLQLEVVDTGIGMQPNVMERIFEPYFTTKDQGKGTGLGLSVTHGIVKSHGGDIRVASQPGKGATFQVYLPLVEKIAEKTDNKLSVTSAKGAEHILLVDDEKQILDLGKKSLQRLGYRVTVRSNGPEALEAFGNRPDQFDLVIADMTMPGMTGIDLAPKLRRIRSDIPVILCSGFSEVVSETKIKALGINHYIQKPIALKDLSHKIRRVLDHQRLE